MDEGSQLLDKRVDLSDGADTVNNSVEDSVTEMAFQCLINSQNYKQARMDTIARYERLYLNDVPPAFRSLSNVIIPVFSGLIDTLLADFNDEVKMKLESKNPADFLTIPKIQAHLDNESKSLAPNAMWNQKARWGRFNAMFAGRDILQNFAASEPEYVNTLETINYSDFHCEPLGGGDLELHLFAGREGIYRTLEDVWTDESYPKEQRKKLKDFQFSSAFWKQVNDTYGTKLQRFYSQGLDPQSNSMPGDRTLNLCRFVITYQGERWGVLFEPLTKIWLDCRPWKEIRPTGLMPWYSYATHEDHKVFWSKSYADDFYQISLTVNKLYNQEITNREKQNHNARAYDPEMFTDVQKLDRASYEPDTLVPFNSQNGTRRAEQGIYTFQVQGLNGTIDLTQNLMQTLGNYTGANELSLGGDSTKKKPTVILAQQQQLAKRIGFRTDAMKECYGRVGQSFIEGLKEHMPVKLSVQVLGENGFIEEQDLTRIEVKRLGQVSVSIQSTSEQENADNLKRDSRIKAIQMVATNPNLSKYEKETIYRDVGMFDENEIAFLLNTQSYESRKQIAHASLAIQDLFRGKEPEIYYGADDSFMQYIQDYIIDNRSKLKEKYPRFFEFLNKVAPIAASNVKRKAEQKAKAMQLAQAGQPAPDGQENSTQNPVQNLAQRMGKVT